MQDDDFAVIYHNCGNNVVLMSEGIFGNGAMGYHFGNAIRMADILPNVPADRLAMGNVDPAGQLRNGTPESVRGGHPGCDERMLQLAQFCHLHRM